MKLLHTFLFTAVTAIAAAQAFAQSTPAPAPTPPQLPPGPLLNPVPDLTKWTIAHRAAKAAPANKEPEPSQNSDPKQKKDKAEDSLSSASSVIVGARTGDIRHILITYSNGNKTEFWKKGHMQAVISSGWKAPMISVASEDDLYGDFGWISASNFQGISATAGSTQYMVFRDKILPPGVKIQRIAPLEKLPENFKQAPDNTPDPETLKVKAVASIELDRRLPAAVQIGDDVTTYKFETLPPGTMMTLPPDVAAAMASQGQALQPAARRSVMP